jgi:hypothetical protein
MAVDIGPRLRWLWGVLRKALGRENNGNESERATEERVNPG